MTLMGLGTALLGSLFCPLSFSETTNIQTGPRWETNNVLNKIECGKPGDLKEGVLRVKWQSSSKQNSLQLP